MVSNSKDYAKNYFNANKEHIRAIQMEKIICSCGKSYTKQHQKRHLNSTYHKKNFIPMTMDDYCNDLGKLYQEVVQEIPQDYSDRIQDLFITYVMIFTGDYL